MYSQEVKQGFINLGIKLYNANCYRANLNNEQDQNKVINYFIKKSLTVKANLEDDKLILKGIHQCMLDKKLNKELKEKDKDGKGNLGYEKKDADLILLKLYDKLENALKDMNSSKSLTSSGSSK